MITHSKTTITSRAELMCWHLVVCGFVQGVGFRPFVFHLANDLGVKGYVLNNAGQVSIQIEANRQVLDCFTKRLIDEAPTNAEPVIQSINHKPLSNFKEFSIRLSRDLNKSDIHILPDLPVCEQCLCELFDKNNRRYLYPFINCTQCGPRYSIINTLPYDRKNTSMQNFKLCNKCETEYTTLTDRRFHAEPVACEDCGPVLNFSNKAHDVFGNRDALDACVNALSKGLIVAIKNVSGYHLMCDATSSQAIATLRKRKHRPDKPFALLINKDVVGRYVDITRSNFDLLESKMRPVVLLKRNINTTLPDNLAPGLNYLGVMLPNNPLQHLISYFFKKPLVSTSANISGEPIITDNDEASQRLSNVCDAFLHHNRNIVRPADDPVVVSNNLGTQILRTGRGCSPREFTLSFKLQRPVLALGGHIKNTIALAWNNRLVLSSHNGDLSDLRSYQVYKQSIQDLQTLYQVQAEQLLCDSHPDYGSSRWASQSGLPVTKILHHHAHASSVCVEHPEIKHWLMFCWDGVGLGDGLADDANLWGGETFMGGPGNWKRVASFRSFRLPGGEKTAREAWRISASLCWHSHLNYEEESDKNLNQLKLIWNKKLNSPETSAVGRLFSGAASLLGLLDNESFEGHGPMLLESLATTVLADALELPLTLDDKGVTRVNWQPLIYMLKDTSLTSAYRARCFHESLAECVVSLCLKFNTEDKSVANKMVIGLSGGVFQNKLLVQLIKERLDKFQFDVYMPASVPVNDGGLSIGQVIEYYFQ